MRKFISIFCFLLITLISYSQSVSVNTDGSSPDPSAILDVKSTSKGFLLPRMSTLQRTGILNPAAGLAVYDTDTKSFWFFDGLIWKESATGSSINYWTKTGNDIFNNNSGNIGIGTPNPDSKLSVFSNTVASNDNTYLLSLHGRNPVINFTDENNVAYGYIKSWTHNPYPPFSNGMLIGSVPGYPIFFSTTNGYGLSMAIVNSGDVGIGTALPDARLSLFSNTVASNDNTYLLSLHGRNPVINFTDENNVAYGYIKSWTHAPYAPFTNGLLIGSTPGNPIFFSTNYGMTMIIADNGNVGIGTANPTFKLSVNGNVRSKEVVVESNWADFVFDDAYKLPSLKDVEKFILQNQRLPEIPSADEIQKNGLPVGSIQSKMMQKIEELTLYVIELQKQIDQLKSEKNETH